MFKLTEKPIIPTDYKSQYDNPEAGALVTFEGRVRNNNDGKIVEALEYEAYEQLSNVQGVEILNESLEKFNILQAFCVHRIGYLAIKDIAVWIGVISIHRKEAFSACQFIIDEIKIRVPIWKKEHYTNGDSGWINCSCTHSYSAARKA